MSKGTKYTLVKKAYKINLSKIEEGYLYSDQVCYSDNRSKAKTILLDKATSYCDMMLKGCIDLTYINMPIVRAKEYDLYSYKGEEITKYQIEDAIKEADRQLLLDSILENKNIQYCYIRKGSYYRPNACGYTDRIAYAGVFTKEEALKSARTCRDLELIPIDIAKHNAMIQEEIDDLKTRHITTTASIKEEA